MTLPIPCTWCVCKSESDDKCQYSALGACESYIGQLVIPSTWCMRKWMWLYWQNLALGACERMQQSRYLRSSLPGSASSDDREGDTFSSLLSCQMECCQICRMLSDRMLSVGILSDGVLSNGMLSSFNLKVEFKINNLNTSVSGRSRISDTHTCCSPEQSFHKRDCYKRFFDQVANLEGGREGNPGMWEQLGFQPPPQEDSPAPLPQPAALLRWDSQTCRKL